MYVYTIHGLHTLTNAIIICSKDNWGSTRFWYGGRKVSEACFKVRERQDSMELKDESLGKCM